jgi:hypothetical protein
MHDEPSPMAGEGDQWQRLVDPPLGCVSEGLFWVTAPRWGPGMAKSFPEVVTRLILRLVHYKAPVVSLVWGCDIATVYIDL